MLFPAIVKPDVVSSHSGRHSFISTIHRENGNHVNLYACSCNDYGNFGNNKIFTKYETHHLQMMKNVDIILDMSMQLRSTLIIYMS